MVSQAREQARQKDAIYAQEKLKFFNKETQLDRTQNRNIIGYSRDLANAEVKAIYAAGQGRLAVQEVARRYFAKQSVDEGKSRGTKYKTTPVFMNAAAEELSDSDDDFDDLDTVINFSALFEHKLQHILFSYRSGLAATTSD